MTIRNLATVKLLEMGFRTNTRGFVYMVDAAELAYNDREYLQMLTKRLYPDIAKRRGTNTPNIERAIRYSLHDNKRCMIGTVGELVSYLVFIMEIELG